MKKQENKIETEGSLRVKAVFEKLPWLKEHYNPEDFDKVSFTTLNRKILETSCGFKFIGEFERDISFFSENGVWLGKVGVKWSPRHAWSIFRLIDFAYAAEDDKSIRLEERVIDALRRINLEITARLQGLHPVVYAIKSSTPVFIVGVYHENGSLQMKLTVIEHDWEAKYCQEVKHARVSASMWATEEIERTLGRKIG